MPAMVYTLLDSDVLQFTHRWPKMLNEACNIVQLAQRIVSSTAVCELQCQLSQSIVCLLRARFCSSSLACRLYIMPARCIWEVLCMLQRFASCKYHSALYLSGLCRSSWDYAIVRKSADAKALFVNVHISGCVYNCFPVPQLRWLLLQMVNPYN